MGTAWGDCCNPPRLSFLLNQGRHPGRSVRCDSDPARLKIIAPRDPQCLTECYHAYWLPSPKERRNAYATLTVLPGRQCAASKNRRTKGCCCQDSAGVMAKKV